MLEKCYRYPVLLIFWLDAITIFVVLAEACNISDAKKTLKSETDQSLIEFPVPGTRKTVDFFVPLMLLTHEGIS